MGATARIVPIQGEPFDADPFRCAPACRDPCRRRGQADEVRLAEGQLDAVQLRLLTAPDRQILWAASFADSSSYFKCAPTTLNSILRHIEDREIAQRDGAEGERLAYRFTIKAQRLLNAVDLPSIWRARRRT